MTSTLNKPTEQKQAFTTYHEKKVGKTLYRVTSVFKGEIELGKALEDLTVRKILHGDNASIQSMR